MKNNKILTLLEQFHKTVVTGKNYAKNNYDLDRYSELENLAKGMYSLLENFDDTLIDVLAEKSYLTPKVGVNAIIENENGEFLLELRMDDKCWGILGGWAEVGLTAQENIIREVKEESGFDVEIEQELGVICRKPTERYILTSYHILFKCKIIGGKLQKSYESENVQWKKIDEISNWHHDHKEWFNFYFERV